MRLPTLGAHSMYMTDIGHIHDRCLAQWCELSVFSWSNPAIDGKWNFVAEYQRAAVWLS